MCCAFTQHIVTTARNPVHSWLEAVVEEAHLPEQVILDNWKKAASLTDGQRLTARHRSPPNPRIALGLGLE
jgi:hypothetical protein